MFQCCVFIVSYMVLSFYNVFLNGFRMISHAFLCLSQNSKVPGGCEKVGDGSRIHCHQARSESDWFVLNHDQKSYRREAFLPSTVHLRFAKCLRLMLLPLYAETARLFRRILLLNKLGTISNLCDPFGPV